MISLSQAELELINTEVFLRLHRIKQLSHAYVVYPSALHTRYEHSLGAMHVAGQMCEKLGLDDGATRLVRIAALLHDVGHGPFSHLFEDVLKPINSISGPVHEHITRMIIQDDPEIKEILGGDRNDVIELLNEDKELVRKEHRIMSDIVSSSLDADKLDYLARDSYHLGVNYGKFDLVRILHTICSTPDTRRLGILRKGMDALENYRLSRHLMTTQAYKHHARLSADQMFLSALRFATGTVGKERIIPRKNLTVSSKSFLPFYKKLDDCSIVDMIVSDKHSKISKEILLDIRARRLLKRAYEVSPELIKDDATRRALMYKKDKLSDIAKSVREQLNLPDHRLIVHESKMNIKLYGEDDIPCVGNDGKVDYMYSLSPIKADGGIVSYYVFGPESKRDIIRKKFEKEDIRG